MAKRKTTKDRLLVTDPDNPTRKTKPVEQPEEKPIEQPEEQPEDKPEELPEEKPEEQPEEKPEEGGADAPSSTDFDELMGKIENAEPPKEKKKILPDEPLIKRTRTKKKKGQSDPDSFRVEGYVLMLVTDTVFPAAFAFINNMLDKRIKIQAHDLSLSDQDWAKLEPLADQAADYMSIQLNPIAGFFMVSTFMYGNALINVRMQMSATSRK